MKKIILLLATQFAIYGLFAQPSVINKAKIKVMSNTYLVVNSTMNYTNSTGAVTEINGAMRVDGNMNNLQGNTGIIVNNSANLLQNSNNVAATVRQNILANKWHLISNPVATFNFANAFNGVYVYEYIENSTASSNSWLNITSGNMQTDRGYLVKYASNKTINFVGNLNNGDMDYNLKYTAALGAGAGYNLVGNPYPCAIDWTIVAGFDKANITNTAYVWDDVTEQYGNTNGTVFTAPMTSHTIPSCQGFIVKTTSDASTFTIKNLSKKIDLSTPFYKQKQNNLLRIRLNGEGKMDETVVYYETEATQSYDLGIDADKFFGTKTNLYTKSEDTYNLAINATKDIEQSIPLCFSSEENGNFTLLINEFSLNSDFVYLEDKKTETIKELSENIEYSFSYLTEDNPERFVLHFKKMPMALKDVEKENIDVFTSNKQINIHNAENSNVEIYDLLGKKIYSKKNYNLKEQIQFNKTGVFIIKVMKDAKIFTKKIFLK